MARCFQRDRTIPIEDVRGRETRFKSRSLGRDFGGGREGVDGDESMGDRRRGGSEADREGRVGVDQVSGSEIG